MISSRSARTTVAVSFARQPSIHGASSPDRNGPLAIAIATFACLAGSELCKGEAVFRSIPAQAEEQLPSKSPAFRNIHAIPGPARGLQGFSSSALYA